MRETKISLQERLQRLKTLDLSNVRRKLMEPFPEGRGWSKEQALEAEKWYKRYLEIIIKFPNQTQHVPNGPIDFFWHQHILDTLCYGKDCDHVLGYFLHHYPYYGLNGDADARDTSFDETNELYRIEFGEDCLQMKNFHSKNDTVVNNGTGCKDGGSGTGCKQGCRKGGKSQEILEPSLASDCSDDAGTCQNAKESGVELTNATHAMNCNHAGSGTGCGQGCSRKNVGSGGELVAVSMNCNHAGSGTGCGQGCSRRG